MTSEPGRWRQAKNFLTSGAVVIVCVFFLAVVSEGVIDLARELSRKVSGQASPAGIGA